MSDEEEEGYGEEEDADALLDELEMYKEELQEAYESEIQYAELLERSEHEEEYYRDEFQDAAVIGEEEMQEHMEHEIAELRVELEESDVAEIKAAEEALADELNECAIEMERVEESEFEYEEKAEAMHQKLEEHEERHASGGTDFAESNSIEPLKPSVVKEIQSHAAHDHAEHEEQTAKLREEVEEAHARVKAVGNMEAEISTQMQELHSQLEASREHASQNEADSQKLGALQHAFTLEKESLLMEHEYLEQMVKKQQDELTARASDLESHAARAKAADEHLSRHEQLHAVTREELAASKQDFNNQTDRSTKLRHELSDAEKHLSVTELEGARIQKELAMEQMEYENLHDEFQKAESEQNARLAATEMFANAAEEKEAAKAALAIAAETTLLQVNAELETELQKLRSELEEFNVRRIADAKRSETSEAGRRKTCMICFKIENLTYGKLHPQQRIAMANAVAEEIASVVGVARGRVRVELSQGSVHVRSAIDPLSCKEAEMVAMVALSQGESIKAAVILGIRKVVSDVSLVASGNISVGQIDVAVVESVAMQPFSWRGLCRTLDSGESSRAMRVARGHIRFAQNCTRNSAVGRWFTMWRCAIARVEASRLRRLLRMHSSAGALLARSEARLERSSLPQALAQGTEHHAAHNSRSKADLDHIASPGYSAPMLAPEHGLLGASLSRTISQPLMHQGRSHHQAYGGYGPLR